NQPFLFEATLQQATPTDLAVVQVFVTNEPAFNGPGASKTSYELVCYLLNGQLNVATADGTLQGKGVRANKVNHGVVKVEKQQALIECDGQLLYAGPHGLPGEGPRYPGIRFLTKASDRPQGEVSVLAARVLKP